MSENKAFQLAFLISVLLHFTIFLGMPRISFLPQRRHLDSIKISYYKIKDRPKKLVGVRPETLAPRLPEKLPEVKKEDILKTQSQPVKVETKSSEALKEVKEKKFEAIVKEEEDKAKKATYINYYQSVRERIRYFADRNYVNERSTGQGEVLLSFIVASSGELLQVRIIEERSVRDPLLRSISINSIRDASPFPPFPQGMNQYQITFNVIISFEVTK
jgi:outer membrane biosynthesis protein TonB